MQRKYEIVVLSKGAFARTLKIYNAGRCDRAVIYCGGKSIDELIRIAKAAHSKTALITIEGTPVPNGYFPFDTTDECGKTIAGDGKALCSYILETVLPYLDKRFGFIRYALAGSGAAGLTAAYAATMHSDRITAYAMYTAPFFLGDGSILPRSNALSSDMFYVHARADIPDIDEKAQDAFTTSAAEAYARIRRYAPNAKLRVDFDADAALEEFLSDFCNL